MREIFSVFVSGSVKEIAAQLIGFLALAASVISFQMKTYRRIMLMQILCAALFAVHMGFLTLLGHGDAVSGCVSNVICLIRDVVFLLLAGREEKHPRLKTVIFCVLLAGVGVVRFSPVSLLCIVGMLLNTVSFSMTEPQRVRRIILISAPFMFAYELLSASAGGAVNELISFCSAVIGLLRYRKAKG